MLYAPIRLFNLGLHNYKIEKQNKQIKEGGGGGRGVPIPLITYPCIVW